MDPPPRSDARRSLRPADRPGQHAPRLPEPRRHRPVRPGRPGADRAVGPVADPAGPSPCWPTTRCTTTAPSPSRPTTTAGSPPRWPGGSGPSAQAGLEPRPPFVAIMSQGTSGDQMWMDYGRPEEGPRLDAYADAVAATAERAYRSIAYRDHVPLAMAETTLVLGRRVPDEARLAWARGVVAAMKDQGPPPHPARGLRQGGHLPARRAPPRAEAPGHPGRRAGHHGDPERGLRHHRAEDQGPEPVRPDDEHRAGQRLRGLHPAPRAARAGRLHDLAGAHRRAGGPGRAEDRRGRAEAAREGRGPAPARHCRSRRLPTPRPCWPRSRWPTGGSTRSRGPPPSIRAATVAMPPSRADHALYLPGADAPGLSDSRPDQPCGLSRRRPPQGPARPPAGDLHRRALVLERLAGGCRAPAILAALGAERVGITWATFLRRRGLGPPTGA